MARRAPALLALRQKRPRSSTQKKAVSSPPKANMLMIQMREGGVTAMKKTSTPMTPVAAMDSSLSFLSETLSPLAFLAWR